MPLHQEPGQKPGQPGLSGFLAKLTRKMRPGQAWQAWLRPSFLGNLGHKSPAFWAMLIPKPEAFLDFQPLKSSLEKPSIFGHVVPEKMYLVQLMLHFSHGVKVIGCYY